MWLAALRMFVQMCRIVSEVGSTPLGSPSHPPSLPSGADVTALSVKYSQLLDKATVSLEEKLWNGLAANSNLRNILISKI